MRQSEEWLMHIRQPMCLQIAESGNRALLIFCVAWKEKLVWIYSTVNPTVPAHRSLIHQTEDPPHDYFLMPSFQKATWVLTVFMIVPSGWSIPNGCCSVPTTHSVYVSDPILKTRPSELVSSTWSTELPLVTLDPSDVLFQRWYERFKPWALDP